MALVAEARVLCKQLAVDEVAARQHALDELIIKYAKKKGMIQEY